MEKKSNAVWIVVGIVVVAVLVFGGISIFHPNGNAVKNVNPSANNPVPPRGYAPRAPASEAGQLFSASQFSKFAYLIFPGALSSSSKAAIIGFNLTTYSNSNGSTTVNLLATNPHFKNLSVTVPSGDKLYFIETNPAEDHASNDYDSLYMDDKALVVNSTGYIVNGPLQA